MTEIIKFPSGLRVAFKRMESTRAVSMGVFVGAGSARENASTNGISHFIEHMMFKGTERRTAFQIAEEMESIGAMINAYTSRENTCYYSICTADHTEECMDFLSDIYFHSTFEDDCIAKEKEVVIEEINMCEDDPSDICEDLILKSAFGNKGVGLGILGPKKNIKRFTRDDIKAYMDKFYVASNTVLAIAGNLDRETTVKLVERYFESEFSQKPKKKVAYYKVPVPCINSLVRKKDCEQSNLAFSFPMMGIEDNDIQKVVAFSRALGGNMSSRLFQKLREERGLVYDVDASVYSYSGKSAFIISLATSPNKVEEAVKVVAEVLSELVKEGFTEKEVNTCREQYKVATVLSVESSSAVMRLMGKRALYGLDFDTDARLADAEKMNAENINKVMRDVLDMQSVSAAYVGKDCKVDIFKLIKGEGQ